MKLIRIVLAVIAASLGGTHGATLCGVSEDAAGALDVIHNGPGNGTLTVSDSFAERSVLGATAWIGSGSLTTSGSARLILPGNSSVGGTLQMSSSSIFTWDLIGITQSGSARLVSDGPLFLQSSGNGVQWWSDVFNPPTFQTGGSIGVLKFSNSKDTGIFNLTAPDGDLTLVPEPSSSAICGLLVAAGLLRRRRVDSGRI